MFLVMHSVIHKRVFTPSWEAPVRIMEAMDHSSNSNSRPILIYIYVKVTPRRNFKDFVNRYAIVELEKWSTASIIRAETSCKGVKTILWIKEYNIKGFVILMRYFTKNLNWPTGVYSYLCCHYAYEWDLARIKISNNFII